ncbi:peroxiredoxin [Sulfolobales archaeon HS-7]|nr:peroxiredoxin [Sulfolobales archaeon HS-7]
MQEGELAPDFEGIASNGEKIRLSSFKGKKVILYFYPRAFTPGCTRETERFAQLYDEFVKRNAVIIGISVDTTEKQRKFAETYCQNKFLMVSDKEKTISKTFGVLNEKGTSAQRVTFIIDENGKVMKVLKDLKSAEQHADKALELLSANVTQ